MNPETSSYKLKTPTLLYMFHNQLSKYFFSIFFYCRYMMLSTLLMTSFRLPHTLYIYLFFSDLESRKMLAHVDLCYNTFFLFKHFLFESSIINLQSLFYLQYISCIFQKKSKKKENTQLYVSHWIKLLKLSKQLINHLNRQ